MSQVELSISTNVANGTAHKLMAKSRRGSGLNVSNLAAYSQLAANEGLKLNIVAVGSRNNVQSDYVVASPASQSLTAATIDQGVTRFGVPDWNARLSGVMVGMLVAFAVGSQASNSLLSDDGSNSTQGISVTQGMPITQAMPIIDAGSQAVSAATSAPLQSAALIENVTATGQEVEQPNATQSPDENLLAEAQALIAQQAALEEQLDMLDYVNVALNKELLQMELAVLALEAEAQKNVEVRTVYNFVNAPVASDDAALANGIQLAQVTEVRDQAYYDQLERDAYLNDYE